MALTALVDDLCDGVVIRIFHAVSTPYSQLFVCPFETVMIHKSGPSDRRTHRVAVEVLHIAHSDIDRLLVNLAVKHIEVNHQFIAVERPVEVQFGQCPVTGDRCVLRLICQCRDVAIYEWQYFVYHLAGSRIFELTTVVDREALFEFAVGVEELLFERQVSDQTHLVSHESDVVIRLHKRFRQCLLEHSELIDVTGEVTSQVHIALRTGCNGCGESLNQTAVHKQGGVVIRAVDRQHDMMPFAVGIVDRTDPCERVGAQYNITVLQRDERAVFIVRTSGTEEVRTLGSIVRGTEPEHKGSIIHFGASEEVAYQLDTLLFSQLNREALQFIPCATVQRERSTVCMVFHQFTLTFAHAIVSQ